MSWGEFQELTAVLIDKLTAARVQPDVIIAITRGGLVPATVLAHHFHCRALGVMTIRRTTSDIPFSLPPSGIALDLLALPEDSDEVRTVLLVDDIVGHGLTLRMAETVLRERYPGKALVTVALVDDLNLDKTQTAETPTPYMTAYQMTAEDWMVFPWEPNPTGQQSGSA